MQATKEPPSILHRNDAPASPVNVNDTLVVVVQAGEAAGPTVITGATGGVRSIVYTDAGGPVKFPFPAPVPPSLLPTASTIESLSTTFNPNVPEPEPVEAVTVNEVAKVEMFGLTAVTAGEPPNPTFASAKSVASTPFTGSLKVTVHCTDAALVGEEPTRATVDTDGGIESTSHVQEVVELVCVAVFAYTWKVFDPCTAVYDLDDDVPVPQDTGTDAFNEHQNVTDTESVNVKFAAVEADGFAGFTVIAGAANGGAANAPYAK